MKVTIAERADRQPVGKVARVQSGEIGLDRTIAKHPDCFRVLDLAHPRNLAELVDEIGPSGLLVAGVPNGGLLAGTIKPKDHLTADSIALSDTAFEWSDGPGLLVLDHDPKGADEGGLPALNLDMPNFCEAIERVVPGLMEAWARWPSSSSCISGAGAAPRGIRGFHYGVFVADATDIHRAGKVLFKQLVLAGLGYGFVTKTGLVSIRTIIDDSVWRPSHKIFAGGVSTRDGLQQDRRKFIKNTKSGTPVNTAALLPDLTDDEDRQYAAECMRLTEVAKPLSEVRRAKYEQDRVKHRAKSITESRKLDADAAGAIAREQVKDELDSGTLSGDAEIVTRRGIVTVDQILADPAKWHGESCADPFEPDYGAGVGTAKIYVSEGRQLIRSFAHGGRNYYLRTSPEADFGHLSDQPAAAGETTSSDSGESGGSTPTAADRYGVRNAADLLRREFAPVQWLVEGLIPRGCYLFGGKPKVGKSWLALSLMLGVARGVDFLGRKVESADCLYLALEDNDRRMKERITSLRGDFDDPDDLRGFQYHTEWPRGPDGVARLDAYLHATPKVKVVVIDTLARVKPPAGKNTNAYESDYAALSPYQSLTTKRDVTIILVTHVKKQPSSDPFDDITGSLGQAGAVDGMLVLERAKSGGKGQLVLRGRGRDLDGDWELLIERDMTGQFIDRGSPAALKIASSRGEILEQLELMAAKGASATELHAALPGRASIGSTRNLLDRMALDGAIERRKKRYFIAAIDDAATLTDFSLLAQASPQPRRSQGQPPRPSHS